MGRCSAGGPGAGMGWHAWRGRVTSPATVPAASTPSRRHSAAERWRGCWGARLLGRAALQAAQAEHLFVHCDALARRQRHVPAGGRGVGSWLGRPYTRQTKNKGEGRGPPPSNTHAACNLSTAHLEGQLLSQNPHSMQRLTRGLAAGEPFRCFMCTSGSRLRTTPARRGQAGGGGGEQPRWCIHSSPIPSCGRCHARCSPGFSTLSGSNRPLISHMRSNAFVPARVGGRWVGGCVGQ